MPKKKRSKIKKFLKSVAPMAMLGLGAAALAKNKNRAASMADVEGAEAGFGDMKLKDYGPHTIGNYHTPKPRVSSNWMSNISPGLAYGQQLGFKKGGRVGCGKAKRGFGRALKGGK